MCKSVRRRRRNSLVLTIPFLLPVTLVLGTVSERLSMAGETPTDTTSSQTRRPNILFAIADDWSYGHAGAYGCPWVQTPAFDRVAREGLLFRQAYTPNAKCAPSRACILTGRNSWQLKEACNHICYFPAEFRTYVEALAEHGYRVGATAKGWGPGVAKDANGRNRIMAGPGFNRRQAPPPTRGISNNDYAANFEDFLASDPGDRPWCFWYGALEPHRGYEFGSGVAKGGKSLDLIDRVPAYWPDDPTVRHDLLDYALEVEHFDHHLGRMLKLLEEKGLLDQTLVVVTSDHGMPFPRVKGQAYDASNHVPLAMRWPKGIRNSGRVIDQFVSFVDLAPTFVEIAGLTWEQTGMAPTVGQSLTDLFADAPRDDRPRDHVLIGKERHDIGRPHDQGYPIRGIRQDQWLYIRNYQPDRWPAGNPETGYLNCDGGATKTLILQARRQGRGLQFWHWCFGKRVAEELYNVHDDPDCLKNLAAVGEYAEIRARLAERLESELKAQGDPRMFGQGDVFEKYLYADPRTRGFYERFMAGEKITAGWVNPDDFEPAPLDD